LRPAIPAHVDPEALHSVPELAAAFDWLGQRAVREAIGAEPERARSHSKPGAQRWARFLKPREFVEDAERLPPCSAPFCDLPALTDRGTCGQRGHAKAGRARAPGNWSMADKTAAAKAGKLSLVRGARRLGCDRTVLRRAIKRGDVHAQRVGRYFLIDPAEIERVKREFVCKADGCERVALGETDYCGTSGGGHAGAASRVGKSRTQEDRQRISVANSAHRAEERARIEKKKTAEDLLLIPEIAEDRNRSISLVRGHWVATGLLPAQNHWEGGTHVRLVEAQPYERFLRYYIFGPPSLRERYRRRRLSPARRGRRREDDLRDELFRVGRALLFGSGERTPFQETARSARLWEFYWHVAFCHGRAHPEVWTSPSPERPEDHRRVVRRVDYLVGAELRELLEAYKKVG
jgi:hypothetical protein